MKTLSRRKIFVEACRKKPARLFVFAAVLSLFAVSALLVSEARLIYRKTETTLEKENRRQTKNGEISFSKADLTPHSNQNVRIFQSVKNARRLAEFQNSLFAATDGGLLQLSVNGEFLRHFTVLDGLPESDLTTLAVFQSKLYIGTGSKGLIEFDGEKFALLKLEKDETKSVTALEVTSQKLLIGTLAGGLLEFDGTKLTETRAGDERLEHVSFVRETASELLVGTFADGLWIRKNQIWKHFRVADGLLSNRVVGAEIVNRNLFVATDLGVSQAVLDEIPGDGQPVFRQTFMLPTLSSFVSSDGVFYLTKDNGEIYSAVAKKESLTPKKLARKRAENLQSAKFDEANGELWLLGSEGIAKCRNPAAEQIVCDSFMKSADENALSDNNVSALAIDRRGRLWVGAFRGGIDVFSADGKKLKHLENERIREINSFALDGNAVLAATSGGALRFDEDFREKTFIENTALPNRSVSHILQTGDEKANFSAVSTVKGLIYWDKNATRLFSTVSGLPSNSVLATAYARGKIYAATMSGLAEIENGKVARVFKTSNSALKNNWISALAAHGDRIFLGTYGGGIYELLPSGEIRRLSAQTDKFYVNPNALFADDRNLFAGTLDGVWAFDLTTEKWSQMKDLLPSETVLAVAADRENLYCGTTNGIARINRAEFK